MTVETEAAAPALVAAAAAAADACAVDPSLGDITPKKRKATAAAAAAVTVDATPVLAAAAAAVADGMVAAAAEPDAPCCGVGSDAPEAKKPRLDVAEAAPVVDEEVKAADKKTDGDAIADADPAADAGAEADVPDDESIYPDTEEFFAWPVTGGESGPFFAVHRASTAECALPASRRLVELGVTAVVAAEDEEEDEAADDSAKEKGEDDVEELKELVNACIEDAYAMTVAEAPASSDGEAASEPESDATRALRETITTALGERRWLRVRVARDRDAATDAGVPVTMADFEARQGLIVARLGFWRYLVEAAPADAETNSQLGNLMERFM
ncbi:hypothetical protein HK405_006352 [Cladochytrium tenue]|nr:hypothetical protein HK405_006352 [Cladochytrium tenue]